MQQHYDIIIIGGGPIGASAAYYLSQRKAGKSIALITKEAAPTEGDATYRNAGGCVRWYWQDEEKRNLTEKTAQFIKARLDEGVDLDALTNPYLFLNRGAFVPAYTITGAKLVGWMLQQAAAAGVEVLGGTEVSAVTKADDAYAVTTSAGTATAGQVVVATGPALKTFLPDMPVEFEKRQLFVLDTPVPAEREGLPHTIIPVGEGFAYVFMKKVAGELKVVLGQEEIVEDTIEDGPEDQLQAILDSGVRALFPFIADAKVEKILWGHDATNKTPLIYTADEKLFGVSCGSAVRASAGIGELIAERLLGK